LRDFIASIRITVGVAIVAASIGCGSQPSRTETNSVPTRADPAAIADRFEYPIGDGKKLTPAKDAKDAWFNALDFEDENHLGEDWNRNSGGNTDCGEPVYSAANGVLTHAEDAGPGWGNVVIVTHTLPDRSKVQTLYGHLQNIIKTSGEVRKREKIGTIGNANGKYLCHLHFELREQSSPMWDTAGPGYASERSGWLDPSDFIDGRLVPLR
jgi:murein DD-endopeptidase MepM/ murein hydrolase activator NlpD